MARPDNPYNQKSYPVLGAGIFLTGVVILSIGFILGFEFPKYVLRQGQLRVCITSPSSRGFTPWLYNRNRTKRNFVYIWNMTNVESFVLRGQKPKFDMIGPYVYDELEVKVDVRFKYGRVAYRPWTRQVFNGPVTAQHCDKCAQEDRVMTINRALLQEVNAFPNDLAYHLSLVPRVLAGTSSSSSSNALGLSVSFDDWIGRRDTNYKRAVLNDSRRGSQSPAAYMHLYETLADDDDDGDVGLFRSSLLRAPEVHKSLSSCDQPDMDDALKCGLVFSLLRLRRCFALTTNWTKLGSALSVLVCRRHRAANESCFLSGGDHDASSTPDDLKRAYVEALVAYVTEYLPSVLRTSPLVRLDDAHLVSNVSVAEFVTGYVIADRLEFGQKDGVNVSAALARPVRIRGVLDHEDFEAAARLSSRRITLRTCLFNRSQTENLYYDEIDGFRSCQMSEESSSSCANSSASTTMTGGVQDYEIPVTRSLSPCRQPEPFTRQVTFFIPEMWRAAVYSDYGPAVDLRDIRLRDFRLTDGDEGDVKRKSFTGNFTGYLSWVEMTDDIRLSRPADEQSVAKSNKVLIEPISGNVWCRTSNFQYYVGLKREFQFLDSPINRSHLTGVPLRSHAVHIEIEPSEESRDFYDSEVVGLLRASCVGLIGLSIVGLLVVAFGICVALALIRRPSNRVGPQFYVNPHLPPMATENEGFGGNRVILY